MWWVKKYLNKLAAVSYSPLDKNKVMWGSSSIAYTGTIGINILRNVMLNIL